MATEPTIEAYLLEDRTFPPPDATVKEALINDRSVYDEAEADWQGFWANQARQLVTWYDEPKTTLEWALPFARWFDGGTLNVSYNCLDRHVEEGRGEKVAYHWEGEPGDTRTITYADLLDSVQRFANVLKRLGVQRGDRIAIYMPMIPELPVAMLACTRIGAAHSVVFGGFSSDALRDRINDAEAKVLITSDGGWRRGAPSLLKPNVDIALADTPTMEHVVVVARLGADADVSMTEGRDHWWHELMQGADATCEPERMGSEDLLYLLYTSGTTAKPKGIMHTTGGYLTQVAFTHKYVFDLHPGTDVYWCAADIGWVTGHSYIVYGPLANGATGVMYEGTPDFPDKDRWWEIIERYGVTIFYTAPTAIRASMKWGAEHAAKHDLSSLRLLGTVGEPINPKAWLWYRQVIGGGSCPIVDTWWQTETGSIMITTLPGAQAAKPGSAGTPLPGIDAAVFDEKGNELADEQGVLVLRRPWPSMLRTLYKEDDRFVETYFDRFGKETYLVGDAARKDSDGYFWVIGRIDDVINVSGHRLSTAEVESAIVSHPKVAEAAVIGQSDEDTGQAVCAFVTLQGDDDEGSEELEAEIREHVAGRIGKFARPKRIIWAYDLPKTRSGKIMRRLLRDIAEGRELGDVTTLRDPDVMQALETKIKERQAEGE